MEPGAVIQSASIYSNHPYIFRICFAVNGYSSEVGAAWLAHKRKSTGVALRFPFLFRFFNFLLRCYNRNGLKMRRRRKKNQKKKNDENIYCCISAVCAICSLRRKAPVFRVAVNDSCSVTRLILIAFCYLWTNNYLWCHAVVDLLAKLILWNWSRVTRHIATVLIIFRFHFTF